ncbi:hypothetical protein [Streptomyces sp. TRM68367]|uniref:hypothetical protein n=1 Tax=Streptomyces sp. TRM68367 TaxID=2758415 RepID=UPI00165A4329|nr:hypothetical protein [Streptomyces sp. TRM68367]MBC9729247.1 hypothetical protein [Streptomyces sp. TRM68367]
MDGNGSTSSPYVVGADVSPTPGNALTIDSGGLYVPAGLASVTAGCGITGAGTQAEPLTAKTAAWPYACPIDTNATGVYCDPATGELKGEPPLMQSYFNASKNGTLATPIAVPASDQTTIDTLSITVTNPDPCRPALGLLFREVDLDLTLPPDSGGATGLDNDDLSYLGNTGSSTIFGTHVQENKINEVRLAPGETRTITMNIQAGRGSGGAEITRIQATLRVFLNSIAEA